MESGVQDLLNQFRRKLEIAPESLPIPTREKWMALFTEMQDDLVKQIEAAIECSPEQAKYILWNSHLEVTGVFPGELKFRISPKDE